MTKSGLHSSHRRTKRRRTRLLVMGAALSVFVAGSLAAWKFYGKEIAGAWSDPKPSIGMQAPSPGPGPALVRLPQDDGPHRNFMEWWYYNGHLRAMDGREFTFHYVYFLVNSVVPYTVAQVALTDLGTGRRFSHQKKSPGNPSAGARDGFDFTMGGWTMSGSDGRDALKVLAPEFAFDLKLENPGPTVLHGGTGLLDFKAAGSSYYYSRPRMAMTGTLTFAAEIIPVTGPAWFDHQWGDFQPLAMGWDWFSLQLEDGADIMLYQLWDPRRQAILASGTYTKGGQSRVLEAADFTALPTGSWTSRKTGVAYNTAWKLRIPGYGIDVDLRPRVEDCEFDGRDSTLITYWEGPMQMSGSHAGLAFQEICPPKAARAR